MDKGYLLLYVGYIYHVQPAQVAYRSGVDSWNSRYPPCRVGQYYFYIQHSKHTRGATVSSQPSTPQQDPTVHYHCLLDLFQLNAEKFNTFIGAQQQY